MLIALLGVLAMLLVALLVDPRFAVAGDAHYLFGTARSLAFDGDLDLTNQYLVMGDRWGLGRDPASDGWRLPPREIGPALLMVPGLWLHHVLRIDPAWEPTFACLLAAASLGPCWLGCVRAIEAARNRDGRVATIHPALLAGAAVLGFVVLFYAIGRSGYAHAPDAAIGAWLVWALVDRRRPELIGALLACAVLMRLQNLLWLAWPLLELGVALRGRTGEDSPAALRRLVIVSAITLLGLSPQAWLSLAHPGSAAGAIRWDASFFDLHELGIDLLRVLFGVHGLVRWTPIALLALIGLARMARGGSAREIASLLVLGLFVLLCASVRDVDGGDAFGARRLAGLVGLLALGLAGLDRPDWGSGWRRPALVGLLVLLVAGNLVLVGLAIAGRISLASW